MHSLTRRKLILNVYSLDDLAHHTSLTVTEEVEFDKAPECLFILESEISTKIAVLDENKNKLKFTSLMDMLIYASKLIYIVLL